MPHPDHDPDERENALEKMIRDALRALDVHPAPTSVPACEFYPADHPAAKLAELAALTGILRVRLGMVTHAVHRRLLRAPGGIGCEQSQTCACGTPHSGDRQQIATCFANGAQGAVTAAMLKRSDHLPVPRHVLAIRVRQIMLETELGAREIHDAVDGVEGVSATAPLAAKAMTAALLVVEHLHADASDYRHAPQDIATTARRLEELAADFAVWAAQQTGLASGPVEVPDDARSLTDDPPDGPGPATGA
jgi:hypothetical protein